MIRNNKCSINDIPAEAKLCYVDVSMKGRLMMFFTIKPYSELRGDDWDDSPYEDNAGYPYYEKGERGKTFLVAAPNFSPEDSEDESAYQPMTEWELLNEYTRQGYCIPFLIIFPVRAPGCISTLQGLDMIQIL